MILTRIWCFTRKCAAILVFFFRFAVFASPAGGLRNCNAAAIASFKKYASHFLNTGKPVPNQKRRLMQLLI